MKQEIYLYVILLEHRIYNTPEVHRATHWKVHAIPVEKGKSEGETVEDYIWELRCELADSYGFPHTEEDEEWDFIYPGFVESNSDARFVKYDPSNIKHVMCPGALSYRDEAQYRALIIKEEKRRKEAGLVRLKSKISDTELELKRLRDLADKLEMEIRAK
jgi:hypothetical protein